MYQKDLNMSYLLDFYGEAIPQKNKEILSMYYEEDLSLSEIAENFGISRQGARHLIKKGEQQLLFLEEKLGLAALHKEATQQYNAFVSLMEELECAVKTSDNKDMVLELISRAKIAAEKIKID